MIYFTIDAFHHDTVLQSLSAYKYIIKTYYMRCINLIGKYSDGVKYYFNQLLITSNISKENLKLEKLVTWLVIFTIAYSSTLVFLNIRYDQLHVYPCLNFNNVLKHQFFLLHKFNFLLFCSLKILYRLLLYLFLRY